MPISTTINIILLEKNYCKIFFSFLATFCRWRSSSVLFQEFSLDLEDVAQSEDWSLNQQALEGISERTF